jgi:kinesin family protein 2/24
VNIVGITEKKVTDVNSVMELIEFGHSNRVTGINFSYIIYNLGVTGANDDSSRSHAILQINIKFKDTKVHGKTFFIF